MNVDKKIHVEKGRTRAREVLVENFIESPPIVIHQLAENYGLSVFKAVFEDNEIAGYLDVDKKRVVVNQEDSEERQNFSIAHELGHWLMHRDEVEANKDDIRIIYRKPLGGENNPLEIEANAFAAYLLVPDEMFKQFHDKTDQELASLFIVSQSVIGFRRMNFRG